MSGTSEGAIKAAATNKQRHGEDFFKEIGSKSWQDPDRSHETGFALLPKQKVAEYGRKGGKKTKEEYKTQTSTPTETKEDSTGVSE